MAETIHTTTHFLKRDPLYDTTKPYSLRFDAPEGFPRANIKLDERAIAVHDVRQTGIPDFEKDGCTIIPFKAETSYKDFDDEEIVQRVFLKQVSNHLKKLLKAQHVQVFEHTVRSTCSSPSMLTIPGPQTPCNLSYLHRRTLPV